MLPRKNPIYEYICMQVCMCVYKTKVGERDKEYPLKLSVWGFVMIDGPVCPEIIFVQLVRKQPWRPCRVPITTACVNSVKHRSITTRMAATRATVTTTATVTSHDTNRLQGSKASVQCMLMMTTPSHSIFWSRLYRLPAVYSFNF